MPLKKRSIGISGYNRRTNGLRNCLRAVLVFSRFSPTVCFLYPATTGIIGRKSGEGLMLPLPTIDRSVSGSNLPGRWLTVVTSQSNSTHNRTAMHATPAAMTRNQNIDLRMGRCKFHQCKYYNEYGTYLHPRLPAKAPPIIGPIAGPIYSR